MLCPRCSRPLLTFRLNPDRGRVEPFCAECGLSIELPPPGRGPRCGHCGTDFVAARSVRLLGCEHCYDAFGDAIQQMLSSRRPSPYLFERAAPSSLALSRTRLIQELYETQVRTGAPGRSAPPPSESEAGDEPGCERTEGPTDNGWAITLRIRLMRNLPGLPYPGRMGERERRSLRTWLLGPGSSVRMVVSGLLGAFRDDGDGLVSEGDADPVVRLWTGDEDHLRISMTWQIHPPEGIHSEASPEMAARILSCSAEFLGFQESLDAAFFWQARPASGFLAACPSNTGSGRRLSLQFSTHGLEKRDPTVWLRRMEEARRAGFEVRGSRGERSAPDGRVTVLLPDELPGLPASESDRQRQVLRALGLYERIQAACRY